MRNEKRNIDEKPRARDIARNLNEHLEGCSLIFILHVGAFAPRRPELVYIRWSRKAHHELSAFLSSMVGS